MRLMLDVHISARVATALREEGFDLVAAAGSGLEEAGDRELWLAAIAQSRVLVSYNVKHFVPIYLEFWEQGVHHAGLTLMTNASIPSHDRGAQIRALRQLLLSDTDLTDQVAFLEPAGR